MPINNQIKNYARKLAPALKSAMRREPTFTTLFDQGLVVSVARSQSASAVAKPFERSGLSFI